MAELISLNRARKRQKKQEATQRADMNRLKFGRSKSEREKNAAERQRLTTTLEQHELVKGDAT